MKVQKQEETQKKSIMLQKTLLLCSVLLVSAIVYIAVQTGAGANQAPVVATYVSPPPKESASYVSESVMVARIHEGGLDITKSEEETLFLYQLSHTDWEFSSTLALFIQDGDVKGFTLTMPPIAPVQFEDKNHPMAQYALEQLAQRKAQQDLFIKTALPVLLGAIKADAYFPASGSLAWASLAAETASTGKMKQETAHGLAFTASMSAEYALCLAVDAQ